MGQMIPGCKFEVPRSCCGRRPSAGTLKQGGTGAALWRMSTKSNSEELRGATVMPCQATEAGWIGLLGLDRGQLRSINAAMHSTPR